MNHPRELKPANAWDLASFHVVSEGVLLSRQRMSFLMQIYLGCHAADVRYAKKLVDDILLEYKRSIRPLNDTTNVVRVNFSVFLNQVIELVSDAFPNSVNLCLLS